MKTVEPNEHFLVSGKNILSQNKKPQKYTYKKMDVNIK